MSKEKIIKLIKELPAAERHDLVRKLGVMAGKEADKASYGAELPVDAYDELLVEPEAESTTAEATYAKTAAKAITPENVKKEAANAKEEDKDSKSKK